MSVISFEDDLVLRFPRGDFTDICIRGLVATTTYSTAGEVLVYRWTQERINGWFGQKARYDRWGHYLNRAIWACHRSPGNDGLIQRIAQRIGLPVIDPPKYTVRIQDTHIERPL